MTARTQKKMKVRQRYNKRSKKRSLKKKEIEKNRLNKRSNRRSNRRSKRRSKRNTKRRSQKGGSMMVAAGGGSAVLSGLAMAAYAGFKLINKITDTDIVKNLLDSIAIEYLPSIEVLKDKKLMSHYLQCVSKVQLFSLILNQKDLLRILNEILKDQDPEEEKKKWGDSASY